MRSLSLVFGALLIVAIASQVTAETNDVVTKDAGSSVLLRLQENVRSSHKLRGKPMILLAQRPFCYDADLSAVLLQLYRPQDQFPGGTAAMLRKEAAEGLQLRHLQKARERKGNLVQIEQRLQGALAQGGDENKIKHDLAVITAVKNDLQDAINKAVATGRA